MKRGYAAAKHSKADEKAGGARKRDDRRRAGKEPEVQGRDDADVARGAGSFNENGGIEGKSRFFAKYQEAFQCKNQ
jgi:hypothetical protein